MSSQDALQMRALNKRKVIGHVSDDLPVAIRLKYIGSGSVTSVTVTTATNIVMITSDGGTDTYAFSTYDTVAKLVAAINADGIFEAKVLDTLYSEDTASQFVDGALSITSDGYYDVMSDTSACDYIAYRLTYDRGAGAKKPKGSHRVTLLGITTNLTLGGGADTNSLKVYECKGSTETAVITRTPTTGSEENITWASGEGGFTSADGKDLVVIVTDTTSVTGYLTVIGEAE